MVNNVDSLMKIDKQVQQSRKANEEKFVEVKGDFRVVEKTKRGD
jgi:hypothetical protein